LGYIRCNLFDDGVIATNRTHLLPMTPAATGVREPPARMWKRRAVWGFGATRVREPPARMWKRRAV